jgi:aspartate racemase
MQSHLMQHGSGNQPTRKPKEVWGLVGGLGPLASAEFLKTIYELSDVEVEQQAPIVIVSSDPTFPDRTASITEGQTDRLASRLEESLELLLAVGATHLAVCCVTIHSVFSQLPEQVRAKTVSLVDLAINGIRQSPFKRHLMICSNGSRQSRTFEDDLAWPNDRVFFPSRTDQQRIHEAIYALKRNAHPSLLCRLIESLLTTYKSDCFVAGCTEVHLACKEWQRGRSQQCFIDPLYLLAERIAQADGPRWSHSKTDGSTRSA